MGHDICAIKKQGEKGEKEVASLNRSTFNPLCFIIYNALEAHEFNAFSCGNGDGRHFSKEQLLKGLDYLGSQEDLEPERSFINDCLANLDENGEVYIGFY